MPQLIEAVQKAETPEDKRSKSKHDADAGQVSDEDLERAREEADLASREAERGFPLLYSQALVSLWGSLEDLMHTFLATWVMNEPGAKQTDAVRKLRVSLAEYEALDDEDKGPFIVQLLERELRSPLKHGVSRFERMLDPFGLSGAVDSQVRSDLFEINHIRNVLVHRRGVADRRFVDACSHLGFGQGDDVSVNRKSFDRYSRSLISHATHIIERLTEHYTPRDTDVNNSIGDRA